MTQFLKTKKPLQFNAEAKPHIIILYDSGTSKESLQWKTSIMCICFENLFVQFSWIHDHIQVLGPVVWKTLKNYHYPLKKLNGQRLNCMRHPYKNFQLLTVRVN